MHQMFGKATWIVVSLTMALTASLLAANVAMQPPGVPLHVPSSVRPWEPPLGIPAPSFGIVEAAASPPDPWLTSTPGFYYVNATDAMATDDGNPYGVPSRPRRTIPILLPAGSVVELHGNYDAAHTSPRTITAQGTRDRPVFLRGADVSSRPLIRNGWEVRGTYFVLENLVFGPYDSRQSGSLVIRAPSEYVALRQSELRGNLTGGGLGVVSWNNGISTTSNVVIYKNVVHDNGDVNATYDQDVHGITISEYVHHVWVVDNELYRNSGDGIQINGTHFMETTHHIYVGRNVAHHNKQSGFATKQAVDVIFSQNVAYSHRPGNSSNGACMGEQYGPDNVWWIANLVYDCEYGIIQASDLDDRGGTTHTFFIGNIIHNIHRTTITTDTRDAWGSSAIMIAGGRERYVINNTIYDVDSGINSPSPIGSLEIVNNIVANVVDPNGSHVNLESRILASRTRLIHNLFFPEPRVIWGGGRQVLLNDAQLASIDGIAASPQFVDPAADDFHLHRLSPASGRGELHAVYATFRQLYGIDIVRDFDGLARPRISLGAYEPLAR